jgi:uncharacterized protein (DUF1778 family)
MKIMTKTENVVLRVDKETKNFFQEMADARGLSLTSLILGLLSDGARLERQRRDRVRENMHDYVKSKEQQRINESNL